MPDILDTPLDIQTPLSERELAEFSRQYPGETFGDWSIGSIREAIGGGGFLEDETSPFGQGAGGQTGGGGAYQGLISEMQRREVEALGDQAPSYRQLRAGDVGASMTDGPTITPLTQENYSEDHAKTYIPIPFRMRHHRIGSRQHVALLGARIVLTFVAKKACAEFCRAWNDLMSHIGQAEQFIPNDVIQAFSDVVVGGSGQFGMTNGFSPPFRGRIGV